VLENHEKGRRKKVKHQRKEMPESPRIKKGEWEGGRQVAKISKQLQARGLITTEALTGFKTGGSVPAEKRRTISRTEGAVVKGHRAEKTAEGVRNHSWKKRSTKKGVGKNSQAREVEKDKGRNQINVDRPKTDGVLFDFVPTFQTRGDDGSSETKTEDKEAAKTEIPMSNGCRPRGAYGSP